MSQLGVGGLVDVNLGARLTQVPDNPNTRYANIQGSIIEHALGGLQTNDPRRDCTRILRGCTDGCGFIRGLKILHWWLNFENRYFLIILERRRKMYQNFTVN